MLKYPILICFYILLAGFGPFTICNNVNSSAGGPLCSSCNSTNDVEREAYAGSVDSNVPIGDCVATSLHYSQQISITDSCVTGVILWLVRSGTPDATIKFEIWSNNGGNPGSVVAGASGTIQATAVTSGAYNEILFPTSVNMTAGTYHIVWWVSSQINWTGFHRIVVSYDNTGPAYPSGTYQEVACDGIADPAPPQNGTWTDAAGGDFLFKVMGCAP